MLYFANSRLFSQQKEWPAMLRQYDWENYKKAGGSITIAAAEKFINGTCGVDFSAFQQKFSHLYSLYCPDKSLNEYFDESLSDALNMLAEDEEYRNDEKWSYEDTNIGKSINKTLEELWNAYIKDKISDKEALDLFIYNINYCTLSLSKYQPECFVPYFYQDLYIVFEEICREFCLHVPPVPPRNDYKGRFLHYGEICRVLQEFRVANRMTPAELWAFLYEYANAAIGFCQWLSPLPPAPKHAYFIGGGKGKNGDFSDVQQMLLTPGACRRWQCSPEAERGDVCLLYMLAPVSSVKYMLRAVSPGFSDPFFYHYRCIFLGNAQAVPAISLQEMKEDSRFSEISLVRSNMQGVNGRELTEAQYLDFSSFWKEHGLVEYAIPKLPNYTIKTSKVLQKEKDVEEQLIKPLLGNLGYAKNDYIQQWTLKIGRAYRVIPDFAVLPNEKAETCRLIVEAKLVVPTRAQLSADMGQARSYARRLNAEYAAVASSEGVWLASKQNDFSAESANSYTWDELQQTDNMNRLMRLIGKTRLDNTHTMR